MGQVINFNGQDVDVVNWEEFKKKLLTAIGFQVDKEIVSEINKMRLVDTGKYKQGVTTEYKDGALTITNTQPYALYLEYGTFDYFDRYGLDNFPETLDPKKKDISRKAASKLPKGGGVFAPYRRVLWNKNKMGKIISKAAKLAGK